MYCSNCGKKIPEVSKFCRYCGQTLNKTESSPEKNEHKEFLPAHISKRFLNFVIDWIICLVFIVVFFILFEVLGLEELTSDSLSTFMGAILYFFYYLIFESAFDKSPAKFLTKTKVIKRDGTKPTFADYIRRTLIRMFGIEALSYITTTNGSRPIGWHDTSGTLVVDDPPVQFTRSLEEINAEYEKTNKHNKKLNRWLIISLVIFVLVFGFIFLMSSLG